jgi:broad specificity phosphatase PhoE
MRLFVVRHGLTQWNVEERAQGHSDVELNALGIEQAQQLAATFETNKEVRRILTSDLKRCRRTASAIADKLGLNLEIRPALREICFGICEGLQSHEIQPILHELARQRQIRVEDVLPPGSETHEDVWKRLDPIMHELRALGESAVVVTHGGTGALLMSKLVNGTIESRKSFRFGNTGFYELERRADGNFALVRCNVLSHLESLVGAPG